MKILIAGIGIAGPTLAYWLNKYGFNPVLIEKAPSLREGGQMIEMYYTFGILQKMGLHNNILEKKYHPALLKLVDGMGRQLYEQPVSDLEGLSQSNYVRILRGDLAQTLFKTIEDKNEVIFGDSIEGIQQSTSGVRVTFENRQPEDFDLVIGADGLHSKVRELVFGAENKFEHRLGQLEAVMDVKGYPVRDEYTNITFCQRGKYVQRMALKGDRTAFSFCVLDKDVKDNILYDRDEQRAVLKRNFADEGWECSQIAKLIDGSHDFYFSRISQIKMKSWSKGRVGLIGDAAHCASSWSGEGAPLALISAYILAGELRRYEGDYEQAFASHYEFLNSFMIERQKVGVFWSKLFMPESALGEYRLRKTLKLLRHPMVASLLIKKPDLPLPNYEDFF